MTRIHAVVLAIATAALLSSDSAAQRKPRARDLGIPFDGAPGPLNAITDVAGVEVGFTTLISGDGPLKVGVGPVRTGVTAILPRGRASKDQVFAGWFSLNGNGEMTGTTWIEEAGFLEGPVLITNTHSVGVVRDAAIRWSVDHGTMSQAWSLPVVAETWDGSLNDINGFHVKPEHVFAALDGARSGPVSEGNVGGGTAMRCYGFKCGTGTASRKIDARAGGYTVGVLVQANHGTRDLLRIAGVPVGREMPQPSAPPADARLKPRVPSSPLERERVPSSLLERQTSAERAADDADVRDAIGELGSIIIVVATDAPLLPHQLKRLARRASLGLARTGSVSSNGSGDIFIAFSTANAGAAAAAEAATVSMLSNARIGAVFEATVQATEEAIINALVAAETMIGIDGHRAEAISHDGVREVLRKYNRLTP